MVVHYPCSSLFSLLFCYNSWLDLAGFSFFLLFWGVTPDADEDGGIGTETETSRNDVVATENTNYDIASDKPLVLLAAAMPIIEFGSTWPLSAKRYCKNSKKTGTPRKLKQYTRGGFFLDSQWENVERKRAEKNCEVWHVSSFDHGLKTRNHPSSSYTQRKCSHI